MSNRTKTLAVGPDLVKLPEGQLDRKLYVGVNDALEALGGRWDRKRGGHVFGSDPALLLANLLGDGVVPTKNPLAYFPTPRAIIDKMLWLAELDGLRSGARVLEPSAGEGAIVAALRERHPPLNVVAIELDQMRAGRIDVAEKWTVDFLNWPVSDRRFDRVIMNPPFSVDRNKSEWIDHVRHAFEHLALGGILVAVVPSSVSHRADKRHWAFRDWALARSSAIHALPAGAFDESGTGVNACLLVLRAPA